MEKKQIDELVTKKVYDVLFKNNIYKNYKELSIDLDLDESFIKQIFTNKKKFNIYHLYKISEINNISIHDLIPEIKDGKS